MDQKHGKLPKEVFKFAKSMGIDLEGLEPEAEDMWRMLDEMATNDAIGYHEFVKEQLQSGQPESTEQSSSRSFRPSSGFCVRTKTLDGDGLKIRDITSNEARGKTLFVNVCSSRLIEEATDNGKPLLLGRTTADSLSVPLAIGKPRDFDKESIAIDAVVHPTVVDTANSSGSFRQQIVELILQWVNQESGIKFEKHWEYNDLAYVGGRGDTKNVPVLFMVDDQAQQSMESKQDPLQNTSSLLSEITKNNDSPVVHENIEPSILLNPSPRENKASLIQSLDDPVVNKSNEAKSTKNEVLHVEEESKTEKSEKLENRKDFKKPSRLENDRMDEIFSQFDDELGRIAPDAKLIETEQSLSYLEDLAKALSNQSISLNSSQKPALSIPQNEPDFEVLNPFPSVLRVEIKKRDDIHNRISTFSAELFPFNSNLVIGDLNLQISPTTILLQISNESLRDSSGIAPNSLQIRSLKGMFFNASALKASFKKKTGVLKISQSDFIN